jgi:AraC-like DNA-binding protein
MCALNKSLSEILYSTNFSIFDENKVTNVRKSLNLGRLPLNEIPYFDSYERVGKCLNSPSNNSCKKLMQVMEKNFYLNLEIKEFAKLCGRSLSAFKRDFNFYFRTSPGRWLLARRLQHAHLLLNITDKRPSEIAYECGFENISHFCRAFKEKFGYSPSNSRGHFAARLR